MSFFAPSSVALKDTVDRPGGVGMTAIKGPPRPEPSSRLAFANLPVLVPSPARPLPTATQPRMPAVGASPRAAAATAPIPVATDTTSATVAIPVNAVVGVTWDTVSTPFPIAPPIFPSSVPSHFHDA
ncbi:hypothetical protein KCV01_g15820, partial [Aureobasidium melanogenum]